MKKIAIIGGGTLGTSAIKQFVDNYQPDKDEPLKIVVYEKGSTVGGGLPYPSTKSPIFKDVLVNNSIKTMSLDPNHELDFYNWFIEHFEELHQDFPKITRETLFPPRAIFGLYCECRGNEYLQKAKTKNIELQFVTNTEVTDLIHDEKDNTWHVIHNNEKIPFEDYDSALLLTGHFSSGEFLDLKETLNYYHSPWERITPSFQPQEENAEVTILGSGLSAIDAVKMEHHRNPNAKIKMVSKSGLLPVIKGPMPGPIQSIELKHLLAKKYEKMDDNSLRLTDVLNDLSEEIKLAENNPDFKLEDYLHPKYNPVDWLRSQVKLIKEKTIRPWQVVLLASFFQVAGLVWKKLDTEGKQTLLEKYYHPWMKWLAGMPLESAEAMLELIDSEKLEICGDLEKVEYMEEEKQFKLIFSDQSVQYTKLLINATGHSHDVKYSDSLLIKNLLEKGIILPHDLGGIQINRNNYNVIGKKGECSSLFAGAEISMGELLTTNTIALAIKMIQKMRTTFYERVMNRDLQKPDKEELLTENSFGFFKSKNENKETVTAVTTGNDVKLKLSKD